MLNALYISNSTAIDGFLIVGSGQPTERSHLAYRRDADQRVGKGCNQKAKAM